MGKKSKIYIAGHSGLVGSSLVNAFKELGYTNLLTRTHDELDLINQQDTAEFFKDEKPDYVILAASKVGGIYANNTYRAEFIYENLQIQNNVIHLSYLNNVKKLIFLGSSCIYPRSCSQPMKEEYLLTSPLEQTNEPYAIAKIAGIKMCENYYQQYNSNFISVIPTNLYGKNDNFDLKTSHVLPALIRKFHDAKINNDPVVEVWGSGKPLREFMHVDDLTEAIIFVLERIDAPDIYPKNITYLNIGTGADISIKELAFLIKDIIHFEGKIQFNQSKPDGMHQKLLDVSRINDLGWHSKTELRNGIEKTYAWYLNHICIN